MYSSLIQLPNEASISPAYAPGCPIGPNDLRQLTFSHKNFLGQEKTGSIVLNEIIVHKFSEIMQIAYDIGYPIHQAILLENYAWDDTASMEANNTSGFNYRRILGTDAISNHSYGLAVDVNPVMNPYLAADNQWYPNGGTGYLDRSAGKRGMFDKSHIITQEFLKRGFAWGGEWDRPDYHHFEFIA